jgi:membrane protease YdiL (CAAX protease family)
MNDFPKLTSNETIFGYIYFLLQLLIIPAMVAAVSMVLQISLSETMLNVIFFAINFVVVLILFRKFLAANFAVFTAHPWWILRWAGVGFLIYMAGNTLFSLVVTTLFPDFANINDAVIMEMVQDHFGLMTVGTVLLVPVAEECFYRGLIFRNLYDRHPVLAYGVSMVIFSLAHVAGYVLLEDFGTLALCFVQYLPAGFALAYAYRRSGSIFASILIHMTVNQMGMLLMR